MSYGIFGGLSVRMKQSQHQLLRGMKGGKEQGTEREKRDNFHSEIQGKPTNYMSKVQERKKKSELEEMVRPVNFYVSVHSRDL